MVRVILQALRSEHSNQEIAEILHCSLDEVEQGLKELDQDQVEINNNDASTATEKIKGLKLPSIQLGPTLPKFKPPKVYGRPKKFKNKALVEQLMAKYPNYNSIHIQKLLQDEYGIVVSRRTLQRRISEIRAEHKKAQEDSPTKIVVPKVEVMDDDEEEEFIIDEVEAILDEELLSESEEEAGAAKAASVEKPKETETVAEETIQEDGPLTAKEKEERLKWALLHEDWKVRDWRNLFNMDELKVMTNESEALKDIYEDTIKGPKTKKGGDLHFMTLLTEILINRLGQNASRSREDFVSCVYTAWHSDQEVADQIEQLYESMPYRVQAALKNEGGETEFFKNEEI